MQSGTKSTFNIKDRIKSIFQFKINYMSARFPYFGYIFVLVLSLSFFFFFNFGHWYLNEIGKNDSLRNREEKILQLKICIHMFLDYFEREERPPSTLLQKLDDTFKSIDYDNNFDIFKLSKSAQYINLKKIYYYQKKLVVNKYSYSNRFRKYQLIELLDNLQSFERHIINLRQTSWEPRLKLIIWNKLLLFLIIFLLANIFILFLLKWVLGENISESKIKRVNIFAHGNSIQWILFFAISIITLIFLYKSLPKNEFGYIGFRFDNDTFNCILVKDQMVLLGSKIGLLILYIIITHIFILFPIFTCLFFGSTAGHIYKLYSYYIRAVLHENGISIFIGLITTIIIALIPQFFSATAYFIVPILQFQIQNIGPIMQNTSIKIFLLIIICVLLYGLIRWVINRKNSNINYIYSVSCVIAVTIFSIYIFLKDLSYSQISYFLFEVQSRGMNQFNTFPTISLIGVTVAVFGLWYAPIVTGFDSINSKLTAHTRRIMRHSLQSLIHHIVICGFNDLGQKVAAGIIRRTVMIKRAFSGLTEILSTRDYKFIPVLSSFIAIDANEDVFNEIHPDPSYGKMSLSDIILNGNRVAVLGVVGDCKSPDIIDNSNMMVANIIINTTKNEQAIFSLFNELCRLWDERKSSVASGRKTQTTPHAIIGTENSLFGAYLEWRGQGKGIYFVYPAYLRGIALGDLLFKSQVKLAGPPTNFHKILILGSGKQIYFALEKLWTDYRKYAINSFHQTSVADWSKYLENNIFLVSDEKYIEEHGIFPKKLNQDIQSSSNLRPGIWFLPQGRTLRGYETIWRINTFFNPPSHSIIIDEVLNTVKPSIVLVASESPKDNLAIVQELIHTLRKYHTKFKPPFICAGVRTTEKHQIHDIVYYWITLTRNMRSLRENKGYPLQHRDSIIDYYDDPAEMMIAITDALASSESARKNVIELDLCIQDVPGNIAFLSSLMSRTAFVLSPKIVSHPNYIPSFHNYDSTNIISAKFDVGGFCFVSMATLKHWPEKGDSSHNNEIAFREILISAINVKGRNDVRKLFAPIIKEVDYKQSWENINISSGCSEVKSCPICIYRNHLHVQHEKEVRDEPRLSDMRKNLIKNQSLDCSSPLAGEDISTLAEFSVCGSGSSKYGTFARVINLLLFRTNIDTLCKFESPDDKNAQNNNIKQLIDIKYIRCYECLNPDINHIKIIGNLVKPNKSNIKRLKKNPCLNAILIRALTESGYFQWKEYAIHLINAINNMDEKRNDYWIHMNYDDNFKIILLSTDNKPQVSEFNQNTSPKEFLINLRKACQERSDNCPFDIIMKEIRHSNIFS